jgi:hypothetical protein
MNDPDYERRYKLAKKHVHKIKEFYTHLAVYIVVIGALFIVDVITGLGDWWFYWPALGWGIGLVIHAYTVWGEHGFFGPEWEDRKIRELMGEAPKRKRAPLYEDDYQEDDTDIPLPDESRQRRRSSGR